MENIRTSIKNMMKEHKNKIELFQWAVMNSFSVLFYSYFISQFKQKQIPTRKIYIPTIRSFKLYIKTDGSFMEKVSKNFIDVFLNKLSTYNDGKYFNCPELIIFNNENIEYFKTIFDLYIIPNISKYLPEAFINKFDLNNEKQQVFIESDDINFDIERYIYSFMNSSSDNKTEFESSKNIMIGYLAHETILQLLVLLPTIQKDIILPEQNDKIYVTNNDIVTICNDKALAPILFNKEINRIYPEITKLLEFVSSTNIEDIAEQENGACNDKHELYANLYNTFPFNEVSITSLKEISI